MKIFCNVKELVGLTQLFENENQPCVFAWNTGFIFRG